MRKVKFYFLLLTVLGLSNVIYGQKDKSPKSHQFIVMKDSLKYIQGELRFNPKNIEVVNFRQFKEFNFEQINASKVVEFGFVNGWAYQSALIDEEFVFLRKLISGKPALLKLRNGEGSSYYLVNEEADLVELNRDSFKAVLKQQFKGGSNLEKIVKSTRYGSKSLSRTFLYYSSQSKFYPKFRIGAQVGATSTNMSFYSDREKIDFEPVINFTLGIFADLPIGVLTPFSLRIETVFTESSHAEYGGNSVLDIDYLVKFRTTTLPILVRYRLDWNDHIDFFFEGGFSYGLVSETFDGKKISVSRISPYERTATELHVASDLYGGRLGFGSEYSLNFDRSIGLEFRYGIANSFDEIKMNISTFQVLTSINF
jgi:hypothetical protein